MSAEPSLVPELSVTDCEVSVRFWRDLLGFKVLYDRPEEGFAYLALGGAHLMLDQADIGRTWRTAPFDPPLGRGINFQISVPDVADQLRQYAKRAGHCSWSQKRSGTASARAKRRAFASSSYRTPTAT